MSPKTEIVIVDYGMGNLFNLSKAVNYVGGHAVISSDPDVVRKAQRIILPGVGAFENGMARLNETGLAEALRSFVSAQKPLLGICLGMQLLMDESEEGGLHQGLGIVKGRVTRFLPPFAEGQFKIPHIGWNSVDLPVHMHNWDSTLLDGVRPSEHVYFVHSYTVCPEQEDVVLAKTSYGRQDFCSALQQRNVYGCQFHPEVSGPVGLNILKQFLLKK